MNQEYFDRLQRPTRPVDVVLDTDTYNEIDDQFALAYLIRSVDQLRLQAIYAAPFHNRKSSGPADGMERSYQEIFNVLTLMNEPQYEGVVFRGSTDYLASETQPQASDAASDLVERSKAYSPENPLYVIAIGAITNVASAILIDPTIIDRIVVVWLGGHAFHWSDTKEFNMMQDVAAARVVFGCGVPLVQLPCAGVVTHLATTGPELTHWLAGKNELCDYLVNITGEEAKMYGQGDYWTRVIWDVAAVAWLIDDSFMSSRLISSPIPQYDHTYSHTGDRHFVRYVYGIHRDKIIEDLFTKLSRPQ